MSASTIAAPQAERHLVRAAINASSREPPIPSDAHVSAGMGTPSTSHETRTLATIEVPEPRGVTASTDTFVVNVRPATLSVFPSLALGLDVASSCAESSESRRASLPRSAVVCRGETSIALSTL